MKKLTEKQFRDRIEALQRARKIFIESGITENISIAFKLYQLILAEKDRPIIIDTKTKGQRPKSYFDKFKRPKCPDCGHDFFFRPVPQNEDGIQMQLVCSNPKCDLVLNSNMTLVEWEKELELKDDFRPNKVKKSQ